MQTQRRLASVLMLAALSAAALSTAAFADHGKGRDAGKLPLLLERFEAMDADKDGRLTQAEIAAYRSQRFAAADANGDGKLDKAELMAFQRDMAPAGMKANVGAGAGAGVGAKADAKADAKLDRRATRMIARFDKNGDAALSADEMPAARAGGRAFSRIDTNADGALSRDELTAAAAAFAAAQCQTADAASCRASLKGGAAGKAAPAN